MLRFLHEDTFNTGQEEIILKTTSCECDVNWTDTLVCSCNILGGVFSVMCFNFLLVASFLITA